MRCNDEKISVVKREQLFQNEQKNTKRGSKHQMYFIWLTKQNTNIWCLTKNQDA